MGVDTKDLHNVPLTANPPVPPAQPIPPQYFYQMQQGYPPLKTTQELPQPPQTHQPMPQPPFTYTPLLPNIPPPSAIPPQSFPTSQTPLFHPQSVYYPSHEYPYNIPNWVPQYSYQQPQIVPRQPVTPPQGLLPRHKTVLTIFYVTFFLGIFTFIPYLFSISATSRLLREGFFSSCRKSRLQVMIVMESVIWTIVAIWAYIAISNGQLDSGYIFVVWFLNVSLLGMPRFLATARRMREKQTESLPYTL